MTTYTKIFTYAYSPAEIDPCNELGLRGATKAAFDQAINKAVEADVNEAIAPYGVTYSAYTSEIIGVYGQTYDIEAIREAIREAITIGYSARVVDVLDEYNK